MTEQHDDWVPSTDNGFNLALHTKQIEWGPEYHTQAYAVYLQLKEDLGDAAPTWEEHRARCARRLVLQRNQRALRRAARAARAGRPFKGMLPPIYGIDSEGNEWQTKTRPPERS